MTRKEKVPIILDYLDRTYPDAKCSLNHESAFQILVATMLSAQCTDKTVNIVTESLFQKYKEPADYLAVPLEELEMDIKPTGFFHNKAKNLQGCCQRLLDVYGGEVPDKLEDLVTLPGVGRKTANVVLGNWFNIPGMVVDTHVGRLSKRLGLTRSDDPVRVEQDLMKVVPKDRWVMLSHQLIYHGRARCMARKPKCGDCELIDICGYK